MWAPRAAATIDAMDDVVVVGGRCAGAATAMLLARLGLRVRIVERSRHLSDVVSGHLVKPAGLARLHSWGLLDSLSRTGTPPLRERVLWWVPNHDPSDRPRFGSGAPADGA